MVLPLSLKRYPTGILSSEEPTSVKACVKVTDWAELKSFKKEDANLTRKAGATTTGILPRAEEPAGCKGVSRARKDKDEPTTTGRLQVRPGNHSMKLSQGRADMTGNRDPGLVNFQS